MRRLLLELLLPCLGNLSGTVGGAFVPCLISVFDIIAGGLVYLYDDHLGASILGLFLAFGPPHESGRAFTAAEDLDELYIQERMTDFKENAFCTMDLYGPSSY